MSTRTPGSADSRATVPVLSAQNSGETLDLAWALAAGADEAEVAATLSRLDLDSSPRPAAETDLLRRAIKCIDLTTLAGDDTPHRVRALCARARHPLGPGLRDRIGPPGADLQVAAVCVYPYFLEVAREALQASGIPVAVAVAGFPAGLSALPQRIMEIRSAVDAGADEIDAVINRSRVLCGEWEELYDEVRAFRDAAGRLPLKIILATGELGSLENIARASRICMQAGADFIKTSTGKEAVNATYPAGLVMLREIAAYRERTGVEVGFKPAGGIRTAEQALGWMKLVEQTLGADWIIPGRFRLGASSLLDSIVQRLSKRLR